MAGFVKVPLLPYATRQLIATAVGFSAVAAAAQADDLQVKSIGSFYIPEHEVTLSGLPASTERRRC